VKPGPIQELRDRIAEANLWEKEVEFKRDAFIKLPNTADTHLYYLEDGCVRVFFTEDDKERILYFGCKQSLLSDIDSFFSEAPSPLCIKTIRSTRVKMISKSRLLAFIESDPQLTALWQTALSLLLVFQLDRSKMLLTHSLTARYELLLKTQPILFQEVPHRYIARYLGMSPETLSRLQKS